MSNALSIISGTIAEARDTFAAVLVDRTINFEREAGFAVQILSANDYAMGIATKNRQSVIDAVTNIAAIGISLNPAKKQAYLVPRKNKICLDISYLGLLDLAIASGSIMWGQAELVHEADAFTINGFDKPPTHGRNPFAADRGPVVGVYTVVKTRDGDYLTTTMAIDEVHDIRNRSESWKKDQGGPWKTDPGEMTKKTVIKRAYKLWPKTDRLDQAIYHLNTDGGEGLAEVAGKGADWVDVTPLIAEAQQTTTDEAALSYWKAHNHRLAKQPGDHARLKQAIVDHRTALKARTIDAAPPAPPAAETPPPIDDSFVADMERAEGKQ
jgi:recombination protein RecT